MVTLSVSGLVGLNSAVTRNILGDAEYALLLFDRNKSLMGLKFLKANDPDAYPVRVSPNKGHASITGMAFMKTYNIMPAETTAYPAVYDERNKILTVDLKAVTPTVSTRKR